MDQVHRDREYEDGDVDELLVRENGESVPRDRSSNRSHKDTSSSLFFSVQSQSHVRP